MDGVWCGWDFEDFSSNFCRLRGGGVWQEPVAAGSGRDFASFCSGLSRLRDGGVSGAEAENGWRLSVSVFDIHSRAIVGSGKVGWVVDLPRYFYKNSGYSENLDSWLRFLNAVQASLNDWLEGGGRRHVYSMWTALRGGTLCTTDLSRYRDPSEEPSAASIPPYAVVVSAVVLLSIVYQYLTGNVDTGSSKAYSRSSLDVRDIYVAVVLFLGAYVWIKFREVAGLRGVHERVDKQGRTRYRARLTPPKCNGEPVPRLELGQFATPQEAHNKFRIAAFYYNRDPTGLLDGWFQVPPMSEEERSLIGLQLRAWVIRQAKKVYEDFKKEEAALLLQHRQPVLVNQVENLGIDMTMPDDQGWECASQSLGGMHEGLAFSNGHSLGLQEGCTIPVSQLPPHTASGMSLNGSDHRDLLQTLPSEASLLNSAVHQLPLVGSPAENSGMPIATLSMLDNQGLEFASQSFGGMHQPGFVTSNGPSLGFQEEYGIPIPQLPPNTQSGMGINNSNQLNLPQLVHILQELVSDQKQKLEERDVQISSLQQQLEEFRIHIRHLESQHFAWQQLQVINQGVPSFEVEME